METKYGQYGSLIPRELFEIDTTNLIEGDIFENEEGTEIKYYREGFIVLTDYPSNYLNIGEIKSNWKLWTIPSPQKELIFEYEGKQYYIESSCEMKNPQTRKWQKAIIYISLETGNRYCREQEEFYKLFKEVE